MVTAWGSQNLQPAIERFLHQTATPIHSQEFSPAALRLVPLRHGEVGRRTHSGNRRISALDSRVSADLSHMTELFCEKALKTPRWTHLLGPTMTSRGVASASLFIKVVGSPTVWDEDRRNAILDLLKSLRGYQHVVHRPDVGARGSPAFRPKRPVADRRLWTRRASLMRLHFWALRRIGSLLQPAQFRGLLRSLYCSTLFEVRSCSAPQFAGDSFRWSANPANIEAYIRNGCRMNDAGLESLQMTILLQRPRRGVVFTPNTARRQRC
jgi:hypothetical protein